MDLRPPEATGKAEALARSIFQNHQVALFIIAYQAENHIRKTLERIPVWCRDLFAEIYVIDDASQDRTVTEAREAGRLLRLKNFSVMRTPHNQGYGGNQKIGYTYAIERGYDIVILLHGDGQYPPEEIHRIVAAYADQTADAVFGSRMLVRSDALRGGMPLYKWVGNQVLTSIENLILGTHFSEFHSGYRSYRTRALQCIPFRHNSPDFHFDTDIIIQLVLNHRKIIEIPMPTHYGDEECHVDGFKYAWNCIKSSFKSRLHQAGLFFQPNFEVLSHYEDRTYAMKEGTTSLHSYIASLPWRENTEVLDLGANDAKLSQVIAAQGPHVTAVDIAIPEQVSGVRTLTIDLNATFSSVFPARSFDTVLALDVLEHLQSPEQALTEIHNLMRSGGRLYASTANIGYIVMRLTHLLGWFNYGKRGILDLTHRRLFTVSTFRRLLEQSGFSVKIIRGFGPPILDTFGMRPLWRAVDWVAWILARLWPSLFSFNFLIGARKNPSLEEVFAVTHKTK